MVFDAGLNTSSHYLLQAAPHWENPGLTLWALDALVSKTPDHLELKELKRLHTNIEWYIMFCTMILRSYCELGCGLYVGMFPKSWEICAVKDKAWWLAGEWIFFMTALDITSSILLVIIKRVYDMVIWFALRKFATNFRNNVLWQIVCPMNFAHVLLCFIFCGLKINF